MRKYNLKPKVAIHCKTQIEADAIKAIFSERNGYPSGYNVLAHNWYIYQEKSVFLPIAGTYGPIDQRDHYPYWTESVEATAIIDYVYDDSVLMGAQANFTNLRPEKAKSKDGEVYTYNENPYGIIGMLFYSNSILILRSNDEKLFIVGKVYKFNTNTWSLVDDMELSLKLKQ